MTCVTPPRVSRAFRREATAEPAVSSRVDPARDPKASPRRVSDRAGARIARGAAATERFRNRGMLLPRRGKRATRAAMRSLLFLTARPRSPPTPPARDPPRSPRE